MDILKWNKIKQIWEIAIPGTDKLDSGYIDPTFSQDITVTNPAKGLVLYSATKQWRVTVNDAGAMITTEIVPL